MAGRFSGCFARLTAAASPASACSARVGLFAGEVFGGDGIFGLLFDGWLFRWETNLRELPASQNRATLDLGG
jgi:hypothetical protein